jgi:predicted negative regulator of RcsB-dependent stress response
MKSEVEMIGKNWPEALATLEHAFKLPEVVDPQAAQ